MFKFTNKLEISQIFRSDKHFGNPEGLTKLFIAEKIGNIWFIINTKNISKDKKKTQTNWCCENGVSPNGITNDIIVMSSGNLLVYYKSFVIHGSILSLAKSREPISI